MAKNIQLPKLNLFLAKPDKTTIGKLKHISGENLLIKSSEVSELSFTLPYYISINNKQVRNPHVDKVKEKFLIRSEFRGKTEWFTIESIDKTSEESEDLQVKSFSLGYQLQYHLVIDYDEISRNCEEATNDILKGTDWTVGYINPKFNLKYRQFDIAQGTKLSAIYEIRDTFDSVVVLDTINKTVNHYTEEELSLYKGFNIGYGKYIQNIEEKIDAGDIVTRLYVSGSDGLQINSVNPTGQPYIDDFSYFLYPFEMDKNEDVISHSEYMSDSLAKALVKYNKLVADRKGDFGNYLSEKTNLQKKLTTEQNSLVELENELTIILDAIIVAKNNGESTSNLNTRKSNKNREIRNIKSVISGLNQQISSVDSNMQSLRNVLNMETHLTSAQLDELSNFIQSDEWTDDNQFDVNDLYEAALIQMEEVNTPPINISTSIVNFLKMVSENHNWERFDVHDIIKINHERLGIDVKTTLSEIHYDFDSDSIGVNISNTERDLSIEELITGSHYRIGKIDTELNKRKIDWNKTAYNFNIRNDRIEEIPVNPTGTVIKHKVNDDSSVNLVLNWNYPEFNNTNKNEDNIDGFIIYMYSDGADEPYQFTSKMSEETLIPNIPLDTRAYTITSVPANLFYTIGISAYRRVDTDINRDGILMSEIIGFDESETGALTTFGLSRIEDEPPMFKSYLPSKTINLVGKVNNSRYTVSFDEPEKPDQNDVWHNVNDLHFYIYTGAKWEKNNDLQESLDYVDGLGEFLFQEIGITEEEIREKVEQALKEVDEAMQVVADEVKRIEFEVVPRVEEEVYRIEYEVVPKVQIEVDHINEVIVPKIEAELDRIDNEVVPRIDDELDRINNEVVPYIESEIDRIENVVIPIINNELDRINNEVVPHIHDELDRIENVVIPIINDELDRINNVVVPHINSEINRIENVIIPNVDKAIRETYVPKQNTPPDPTDGSGLWWDTTQSPPRFKRYNPLTDQWEHVAYTEEEIDQIIIDTRNNIETNVITSINISPEDIVIESNRLDIYGVVTFINNDNSSMTLIDGGRIIAESIKAAQINVDEFFANSAVIGIVQTGIVQTSELSATQIITGTLDAKKISVLDLSATSITTGVLDALKVSVQNLSADSIISGTLDALKVTVKDLSADSLTSGTLDALKVTVKNLSADSIISGTLDALKVTVKDLSATSITTGVLDALKVTVKDLSADSLTSGTLDALKVTVKNLSASSIISGTLDALKVNVKDLSADSLTSGTLDALKVSVQNLSASSITSGVLDALKVSVENLSASSIISGTLDASRVNIDNLNASSIITGELTGIDIQGVNIVGSRFYTATDASNYTLIQSGSINSRGTYTRTWRGVTESNDVTLRFQNGYLRARNTTKNWSLYFADFGISTFADGEGDGTASGTIAFRDTSYSSALGLMVHSNYGVVSLKSEYSRVVLDGTYVEIPGTSLRSDAIGVLTGTNFYIGVSGENNGELRVTNKLFYNGGDVRYLDVRARYFYGHQLVSHASNSFVYIGSDLGLRVTSRGTNNNDPIVFRPVQASDFDVRSSRKSKSNIKKASNGIKVVDKLNVVNFNYKHEKVNRIGFIAEDSPELANGREFVSLSSISAYNTLAIQELVHENRKLKSRINKLENIIKRGV